MIHKIHMIFKERGVGDQLHMTFMLCSDVHDFMNLRMHQWFALHMQINILCQRRHLVNDIFEFLQIHHTGCTGVFCAEGA